MEFWQSIYESILEFLPSMLFEAKLAPRFIIAGICGALIGIERKNRAKEAGIRTHLIVALASSLMMVISKYGFFDMLAMSDAVKLDPSRVANGIVSGIGFLGAGIIFVRKNAISGLTTAAGLWATLGIGMAFGAGMYVTGIIATIVVLLCQFILHKDFRLFRTPITEQMILKLKEDEDIVAKLKDTLDDHGIEIIDFAASKEEDDYILIEAFVRLPSGFTSTDALKLLTTTDCIKSVKI